MIDKILMVSSEAVPFAKSGGLADVAGTLPKAIVDNGYDMRVVMPLYKSIKEEYKRKMKRLASFNVKLGWRTQVANIFEYDLITEQGNTLIYYLVQNDHYFERDNGLYSYDDDGERFMFFSKAVLEMLPILEYKPQVLHCNDWQTGCVCAMLRENYSKRKPFYKDMKSIFTIHNLKFQGICGYEFLEMMELGHEYFAPDKLEYYNCVSMMKAGILYSDKLNTVSETYAKEIQMPDYGCTLEGLLRSESHKLYGVLNGIDNASYDPMTDKHLPYNYSVNSVDKKALNKEEMQKKMGLDINPDIPLIAIISRLTDQKGFDMLEQKVNELIDLDAQIIILGTGERRFEDMFKYMDSMAPSKIRANIRFSEDFANELYGSCDMILIPSRFEPCGLTQLISFRYGTVPIARATGGLADTVINYNPMTKKGTGFSFRNCNSDELMSAINAACKLYKNKEEWNMLVRNVMKEDFSWNTSALKYLRLYETMIKKFKAA